MPRWNKTLHIAVKYSAYIKLDATVFMLCATQQSCGMGVFFAIHISVPLDDNWFVIESHMSGNVVRFYDEGIRSFDGQFYDKDLEGCGTERWLYRCTDTTC